MSYIITIEKESKQALAFLDYAKKLGFKVTKEKTALDKTTPKAIAKQAALDLAKTRKQTAISQQEIIDECREVRKNIYEN